MLPALLARQRCLHTEVDRRQIRCESFRLCRSVIMEDGDLSNAARLTKPAKWNQHHVGLTTARALYAKLSTLKVRVCCWRGAVASCLIMWSCVMTGQPAIPRKLLSALSR